MIHDERCEAEFVEGAYGWTECGCSDRSAPLGVLPVEDDEQRLGWRTV